MVEYRINKKKNMEKKNVLHVCTEEPSEARDDSFDIVLVNENDAVINFNDEYDLAENQWMSEIFDSGKYFNIQYGFDLDKFLALVENSNISDHEYNAYKREDGAPLGCRKELEANPINHRIGSSYDDENGNSHGMFWGTISFTAYEKCDWYPAFKLRIDYYDSDVRINEEISFANEIDFCKFLRGLLDCIVCVDEEYVVKMMVYLSKEINNYARVNRTLAKTIANKYDQRND